MAKYFIALLALATMYAAGSRVPFAILADENSLSDVHNNLSCISFIYRRISLHVRTIEVNATWALPFDTRLPNNANSSSSDI